MAEQGLHKAAYIGQITTASGQVAGSCFQIDEGVVVTAYHVIAYALEGEVYGEPTIGARVGIAPLGEAAKDSATSATVVAIDKVNDLAVLDSEVVFETSINHLAYSADQPIGCDFVLTGVGSLAEGIGNEVYRRLNARGRWDGMAQDETGRRRGSGTAGGAAQGMSGCPVVSTSDGAVFGVLSERYESGTNWSVGRVWIATTEALINILPPGVKVPIRRKPPKANRSNAIMVEPLDRAALEDNPRFVMPPAWQGAWDEAKTAFQSGNVVVLSAPPGFGSTTFAERMLSLCSHERNQLVRLEPDEWERPSVSFLPEEPWHSYLLDLRDPEHDQPSESFLRDLGEYADDLKALQSRLIITVTDDIWNTVSYRAPSVCCVRLLDPPDPVILIKQYLNYSNPVLAHVLQSASTTMHLQGMNAVQAVHTAAKIINQLGPDVAAGVGEQEIAKRLTNLLDNHLDVLNASFGDPATASLYSQSLGGQGGGRVYPLSIEDRCLMLALAFKATSRIGQLDLDSRRMLALLGIRAPSDDVAISGSLKEIFARPGLRGRLALIGADVSRGEVVRFSRPSLGPATVYYVWDNYPDLREVLVRWLIGLAELDGKESPSASQWISDLVLRNQDFGFFKDKLKPILSGSARDVLSRVVLAVLRDEHMGRQCERLLYHWADQAEMQEVVLEVGQHYFLESGRDIAIRRVQRVVDSSKASQDVLRSASDAFKVLASHPDLGGRFRQVVQNWLRSAPKKRSSRLGFVACIVSPGGYEWFVALKSQRIETASLLVWLFTDQLGHPALVSLFNESSRESDRYGELLDMIAEAIREEGALVTLFSAAGALDNVLPDRSPFADLSSRLRLALANEN